MVVCRVLLLALVCACAGEPTAGVRWLINENTAAVMGLVGRGAEAGVARAHRFVLLECASYDRFVTVREVYRERTVTGAKDEPPRGCQELVAAELSREQLRASKKGVAARLRKEQGIARVLDGLSDGLNTGAVFSFFGLSGRHSKLIMKVVEKLKSHDILPQIPAHGKIKKGLLVLGTVAMLVTSSGILQRKERHYYQIMLNELSGAEYSHRLQDQEASQENYEAIKRLLISLVEEKGGVQAESGQDGDRERSTPALPHG